MSTPTPFERGTRLEARLQRLFMCQGAFAERGLMVRAKRGESKVVTDIDVIAHDYNINFHHRRIYVECKGGKNKSPLDRTVWIRGVKELLSADFAYLMLDKCDPSTIEFARTLGVDILQDASLATLEKALGIGPTFWPGRSNLYAYAHPEEVVIRILKRNTRNHLSRWLVDASEIWRDASTLAFSYGRLNNLLGTLSDCGGAGANYVSEEEGLVVNYAVSALLVRLCQYVLFAASDTLALTQTVREKYLAERLTVGNHDLSQSRRLLESSLKMVQAQLASQGQAPPASWNIDHMFTPPSYSKPFAQVVERCISEGEKLRLLPISMELRMFGFGGEESDGGRLISRISPNLDLTSLIIAFARQSLGVPEEFVKGLYAYLPVGSARQVTL